MADNTVKIKFEIDGVEYSIDQLQEMGKSAKEAGEEVQDANDKAEKSAKKANKEIGFLGNAVKGVGNFAKKLKGDFMNGFNGVKQFAQGLGMGSKAATGLAVSLSALGIPLLLAAVAALIDYFKNFETGVKILTTAMNVIADVISNVTEAFTKLLTLDFKGFFKTLGNTGDVIKDTIDNTNGLFQAEKNLSELNQRLVIDNAKLNREYQLQNKIVNDSTATFEERLAAQEAMNAAEEQLLENARLVAQAEKELLERQLKLENNYKKRREIQEQLTQLNAQLIEQETALELKRFNAEKKIRQLTEDRVKEQEALAKKELDIRNKFFDQLTNLNQKIELSQIEDLNAREKRKLEIERDNQIKSIQQSEFSESQKAALISKIREDFRISEEERERAAGERSAELEEARLKRLLGIQNEVALLRAENEREAQELRLQQQEAAAIAELEAIENNEELLLATREKFRLLREQQEEKFRLEDEAKRDERRALELQEEIDNLLFNFEALGNVTTAERQRQLEEARQFFDQLLADETLTTEQRIQLEKQRADVVKQIEQDIIVGQQASVMAIQGTFQAIGSALEEGSAAAKAFALGDAIINTYKAANIALASAPPPFGQILAAANIAAGIANVRKILSTKPGKTTNMSAPSASIPRVGPDISQVFQAAQAANPTAAQNSEEALLNQANGGGEPLKAYVISGEVTNAQEANEKIDRLAKL